MHDFHPKSESRPKPKSKGHHNLLENKWFFYRFRVSSRRIPLFTLATNMAMNTPDDSGVPTLSSQTLGLHNNLHTIPSTGKVTPCESKKRKFRRSPVSTPTKSADILMTVNEQVKLQMDLALQFMDDKIAIAMHNAVTHLVKIHWRNKDPHKAVGRAAHVPLEKLFSKLKILVKRTGHTIATSITCSTAPKNKIVIIIYKSIGVEVATSTTFPFPIELSLPETMESGKSLWDPPNAAKSSAAVANWRRLMTSRRFSSVKTLQDSSWEFCQEFFSTERMETFITAGRRIGLNLFYQTNDWCSSHSCRSYGYITNLLLA